MGDIHQKWQTYSHYGANSFIGIKNIPNNFNFEFLSAIMDSRSFNISNTCIFLL